MVILMLHQQWNHAVVQRTTPVHRAKNVLKVMVVHIHWLASIWVNVGHVKHYAMNVPINAIVKLENVRYVKKRSRVYGISDVFSIE